MRLRGKINFFTEIVRPKQEEDDLLTNEQLSAAEEARISREIVYISAAAQLAVASEIDPKQN